MRQIYLTRNDFALTRNNEYSTFRIKRRRDRYFISTVTPLNSMITIRPTANLLNDITNLRRFTFTTRNFFTMNVNIVRIKCINNCTSRNYRGRCNAYLRRLKRYLNAPYFLRMNSRGRGSSRRRMVKRLRIIQNSLRNRRRNNRSTSPRRFPAVNRRGTYCNKQRMNGNSRLPSISNKCRSRRVKQRYPRSATRSDRPSQCTRSTRRSMRTRRRRRYRTRVIKRRRLMNFLCPLR